MWGRLPEKIYRLYIYQCVSETNPKFTKIKPNLYNVRPQEIFSLLTLFKSLTMQAGYRQRILVKRPRREACCGATDSPTESASIIASLCPPPHPTPSMLHTICLLTPAITSPPTQHQVLASARRAAQTEVFVYFIHFFFPTPKNSANRQIEFFRLPAINQLVIQVQTVCQP